ncbi:MULTISPECIES: ABC transporter ATP-binding protein [Burkholderia]|jgi:branched-chain amino acid transport system ATP-binding protein|uniref:Amino acid/amide ABC transporter ATP-binding protein 2, HAAT family n=3 Tax=Burkholderia vietnamiensis TaxID=60552 RepID=A4JDN7_BURVG|nr:MULTISPECIES: ABC transporter ATP-binding protein [Burkholderia]ABO54390.1 amino acid/amide ABC transporter ATP-binding protein 2, HAAT family [Burkholderia vietnamiensis G4]AOK00005.1 ABC transporter ATP-binding protein [Burkholderia vietnamiensis]AOK09923.1 ABC transporter ATP-binding protein [Burkholderia vietnamiensis]AOK40686.1 ABC transporter ATP-binding protein [Burkholderia vietnamiensis]KVE02496.1 ABC transporter ATP-binding protein [Burkholderia vietnamiensis]
MSALLDIRGLRAWYALQPVLDGVDLTLAAGETLALLGRNGSGRSTLAKAVMGLVRTAGSVRIDGVESAGARTFEIARRGVAYVAESRDVFPLLSVRDNLRLGLRGMRGAAGRAALDALLERFALLGARADVKAGRLSGGEQQVLALVRALAGRPRVLIVDEPAEGLAPRAVDEVGACLAALQADGVAILLIEQRLQLAPRLAQRVAVMGRGRIVHDGALAELGGDVVSAWLSAG